ncbi:MAG: transposase [Simkaniaceae bacterium]|jgi:transposase-like protein|nr:transposase [Simkaniaceae bacterium]
MDNKSRDEKLEFWRLVVEEFENSGKSIKEQCESNDIALWQYYDWRKKVRESEQEGSSRFVELDSTDIPEESFDEVGVCLEYDKNFIIRLSEDFSPTVLKSVVKVLKSL